MGKGKETEVDYLQKMRDELGLIPVSVELGEAGEWVEEWVIWPPDEEADSEDDATYIRGQIEQYRDALEVGRMEPDEEVYEDLASLIALKVLLYEELAKSGIDFIEQENNDKLLNFYRSFFESPERMEEMMWAYANGQSENYAKQV